MTRHGYAYVNKKNVKSIQKYGYLSVREQLKHGKVTMKQLKEKYGKQFENAKKKYPNCPKTLIGYLNWRSGTREKGSKSIYYLFKPMCVNFTRGKALLQMNIPNKLRVYKVNPPKGGGLWFSGVEHAYIVPKSGRIPPKHIRILNSRCN